jgi:hypothetical protein
MTASMSSKNGQETKEIETRQEDEEAEQEDEKATNEGLEAT